MRLAKAFMKHSKGIDVKKHSFIQFDSIQDSSQVNIHVFNVVFMSENIFVHGVRRAGGNSP